MQTLLKSHNSILKYLVTSIILVVPLYPKFPFINIPGTYVSVRVEDFLIVAGALFLSFLILKNLNSLIKDRVNQAILLYLAAGAVSVFSAIFVTKTVAPSISIFHWVRRIEYFVPFLLGYFAIKANPKNLQFYLKLLMIVVVLAFFYGIGQRYFSWPVIITQNQEYAKGVALRWIPGSHINSTFAGHYDLASFLVLVLPIFVTIFVSILYKSKQIKTKAILLIVIFSGLWLLINAASRISLVSYLLSASLALILIKRYKEIPVVIITSLLFIGFSSNLLTRYGRIVTIVQEKVVNTKILYELKPNEVFAAGSVSPKRREVVAPTPTPIPVFEDRSSSIRLNVEWPRAIRAFSKNPLLGTGYSSITLATDNDYLRLIGEVGALGFLAFSLIFIRIGNLTLENFPIYKKFTGIEQAFAAGIVGSVPGVLLNAVFIDVFEASKFATLFWLMMGMFIALLKYNKHE